VIPRASVVDIEVARVVVTGAGARGPRTAELQGLIADALARELGAARLPTGTTMRASVRMQRPLAGGAPAVAAAVAAGVARAAGGRSRG
jgi:hypothetical protein